MSRSHGHLCMHSIVLLVMRYVPDRQIACSNPVKMTLNTGIFFPRMSLSFSQSPKRVYCTYISLSLYEIYLRGPFC